MISDSFEDRLSTNAKKVLDTLPIWDKELCRYAAKIIAQRNDFITVLGPLAEEAHAALSGGSEKLTVGTEGGWYGTEEEIAYALSEDLKTAYERDLRLGYTSVGPHRDDLKIILNGQDVRVFGSQGQQRTVALSVKLAETEIFKSRTGEYPILILDDVLSELDKTRQRRLFGRIEALQTIVTCTGIDRSVIKDKIYKKTEIRDGKVKKPRKLD